MFDWIWDNRPHVSELTGKPLLPKSNFTWHHQFAHILSKGTYPKWRLNPDNIMMVRPEEHAKQEAYPGFIEKREEMKREYYREFYNKEFE